MSAKGRIKHLATNHLVRNLLTGITHENVLRKEGKHWVIGNHRLTQDEIVALKEDAEALAKSDLWRFMTREVRFQSTLRMFEKAQTADDLIFGKAMLYNLQVLRNVLDQIRSL